MKEVQYNSECYIYLRAMINRIETTRFIKIPLINAIHSAIWFIPQAKYESLHMITTSMQHLPHNTHVIVYYLKIQMLITDSSQRSYITDITMHKI